MMKILNIKAEDFVNYKKPAMFIGMGHCNWKCCIEAGIPTDVCQNHDLQDYIELEQKTIVGNYMSNTISESIVIGGLEPFNDFMNLLDLVDEFRRNTLDDIVIYTGYYPYEIPNELMYLSEYDNIIIKFGRFMPNDKEHKDKILGVKLASNNQYAVKLNKGSKDIIKAMKDNEGYCPCIPVKHDNTKCCCYKFRHQDSGECHCGIFSK